MTRFISTLLLLVSFAPAMAIAATDGGKVADVPDILKIQAYEVSGLRMNVPIGFLWRYDLPPDKTVRIRNTTGQTIHFHALAQEMTPPPLDLRRHWKGGNGFPKYVMFSIHIPLHNLRETSLTKHMRKDMETGKCRAQKVGDVCPDPYDSALSETYETLYTGKGHEFVSCRTWGSVPAPHCKTSIIFVNDIIVKTSFDRRILNFADPVWDRIYSLVCSWIDLPADRSLTINRCRTGGVKPSN
jgi:hypothetical protein